MSCFSQAARFPCAGIKKYQLHESFINSDSSWVHDFNTRPMAPILQLLQLPQLLQ